MTATEILASVVSIISVIVSIVSIVFAVISWYISHHVNKRMLQIEEKREQDRLAEQNTGIVKLIAESDTQQIYVSNDGHIDLKVTDIILNGISICQHPCFPPNSFPQGGIKLPVNCLYPIKMLFGMGTAQKHLPPYDAVVKWITANGDKQHIEMTVNWV
jgi:hypothetical protein